MKNSTFLIALFATFSIFAQPTYQSTDFASAGASFTVTTAGNFANQNYVQTGASQSWDFSSLSTVTTEETPWVNPNTTGYKTTWCLFNLYVFNCNSQFNSHFNLAGELTEGFALENVGVTNVMNHYFLNATQLESRMLGATIGLNGTSIPFTVDYTVPDVVYEFPITFNDNYTHTSQVEVDFSSFGFPVAISGTTQRTNVVDGWGSLITPAGTYASVLKMKTTLVTDQLITYEGDEIPVQNTTVTYKWFDPAIGMPVMEAVGSEAGDLFIPLRVTFFGQALGVKDQNRFADVNLYPNPTNGALQFTSPIQVDKVAIFNTLGTLVGDKLDVSHLSSGVYFVKITSGDTSFTRKVMRK